MPGVAVGETTAQNEKRTDYDETLDQEYDPLWLGGLSLHDALTAGKLIKTDDVTGARIGEFIDVGGALGVMDFAMFHALWDKRTVHRLIESGIDRAPEPATGNRAERRRQERVRDHLTSREGEGGALIGDIISAIPHRVQARLLTESGETVWATLVSESLVLNAGDLYLKHGVALDGRWRVFGVLDALPQSSNADPLKDKVVEQFGETPFGTMAAAMLPLIQSGFARPPSAWGVTPIMIYRELADR